MLKNFLQIYRDVLEITSFSALRMTLS